MKKLGYFGLYCFYFLLFRWIYMDFLYYYTVSVFTFSGSDFLLVFLINIIGALFLTYMTIALREKRLHKSMVIFFTSIYLLFLVYLLFFKSIGVRGYDFNPFSFLVDIYHGESFLPVMNILFLIPLGCLCSNRQKLVSAMLFLCCAEMLQYIFYLGFFDLGDLMANYIGLVIGKALFNQYFHRFEWI